MGCSGSRRNFTSLRISDQFTHIQAELHLSDIKFSQFVKLLFKDVHRQVSIEQLGRAFSGYRFGKSLLSSDQNIPKKIVSAPMFRARESTLDAFHLFALGLLYCKGDVGEKTKHLFSTFDFNQNGTLDHEKTRILINNLLILAGAVIPSVKFNLSFEQALTKSETATQETLEKSTGILFMMKKFVREGELADILERDLEYLNHPALLRQELKIHWD